MKGKSLFSCNVALALSLQIAGRVAGFSCHDYAAGSASSEFCYSQACLAFCADQEQPAYCMEENYISTGHCVQLSGAAEGVCLGVIGVDDAHTVWCQTTACDYAKSLQKTSKEDITAAIVAAYPHHCSAAAASHEGTVMMQKSAVSSGSGSSCYAMSGWSGDATCKLCASPSANQCPEFGYTSCETTYEGCSGEVAAAGEEPAANDAIPKTTTTTKATTKSKTTATTVAAAAGSVGCWAPKNWSGAACALCSNPVSNQCPSFTYTTCYASEAECTATVSGSGNSSGSNSNWMGGNSGSSSGSSGACASECPKNTLAGGITRPSFNGPSCYNSEYGSQFGPDWVPSGKTRVEKFLPTATDFMRLIRTLEAGDVMPILSKSWGVTDCPAATAAWETFICALELMEVHGKTFEAVGNAPGYKVSELFNTGDEFFDQLELAAFFSHKMKEVARFQVWEENAQGYTDCTNPNYPCGTGQSYHGRGPVQISWNYNYGAFSDWWYGDKTVLLNNADKVDPEGPMGFIAAFWFWATPRQFTSGAPISGNLRTRDAIIHWNSGKLNAMYNDGVDYDSYAGLGLSTNVINGGIECTGNFDSPARRVEYFLTTIGRLGVEIPNVENNAACLSDTLCYGLYRGCSSTKGGAKCVPTTGVCGDDTDYVKGWSYNGCSSP